MTHNPADPFDPRTADEPILETFEFAVEGDHPEEHALRIEKILNSHKGIHLVKAHPSEQRVEVTYDSRETNPAAIHDALEGKNYRAARWAG
jgi:copper chaperone CopZ